MKMLITSTFFLIFSVANASEKIDGHLFVTKYEYHKMGKPCGCPSDPAKNGICGGRAALCKNGGYNISDCGKNAVKSIAEYKKVKKELCGTDF